MKVTRDVVNDLMPLYVAGEVSADSRALVEDYLRAHPDEFAAVEAAALPRPEPPRGVEMLSLERTRRALERRPRIFALAIFLTYAIFSFRFDESGLRFVLFRDAPRVAEGLLAAGLGVWAMFLSIEWKCRQSGIVPVTRLSWMLGGAVAMLPYAFLLSYYFNFAAVRDLCVIGALAGLGITSAMDTQTNAKGAGVRPRE
jgi:hypothetical protein